MRTLLALAGLLGIVALALRPGAVSADLGVGISHSEITVEEQLAQGGRYQLPAVTVTNTGTEAARYEVVITFIQDQRELVPEPGWFRFDPQAFDLAPAQSQAVSISLNPDDDAEPGDYFALIEAHPVQADSGITIGVAAATKLYFQVEPSSFLEEWRLRIAHFFEDNSPFSIVLPPTLAALLLLFFLSRRFRLRIERRS